MFCCFIYGIDSTQTVLKSRWMNLNTIFITKDLCNISMNMLHVCKKQYCIKNNKKTKNKNKTVKTYRRTIIKS